MDKDQIKILNNILSLEKDLVHLVNTYFITFGTKRKEIRNKILRVCFMIKNEINTKLRKDIAPQTIKVLYSVLDDIFKEVGSDED